MPKASLYVRDWPFILFGRSASHHVKRGVSKRKNHPFNGFSPTGWCDAPPTQFIQLPNKTNVYPVKLLRLNGKEQQVALIQAETEATLIAKAQNGDRNAYGELVRHYHPGVVNVVYHLCGNTELAEDAAQEAFIRAWLHLPSFQPGTPLRNWLYRIAVNAALDVLRRDTKTADIDFDNLALPDPQMGPEAALLQKERTNAVQQAILALTDASRAVLVLREYGGLSYQEISAALNIPLGTVMSRLNYARTQLKQLLEPQFINMELENVQ
jgi:RNA polymerase sigma-70 factor, ECF subfamily